jgi:hypothetical protein
MKMRARILLLFASLALATAAHAQSPAPSPDPRITASWLTGTWLVVASCEERWTYAFGGDGRFRLPGQTGRWRLDGATLELSFDGRDGAPERRTLEYVNSGNARLIGEEIGLRMLRCPEGDPEVEIDADWLVGNWTRGLFCGGPDFFRLRGDGTYWSDGVPGRWWLDGNLLYISVASALRHSGTSNVLGPVNTIREAVRPTGPNSAEIVSMGDDTGRIHRCS